MKSRTIIAAFLACLPWLGCGSSESSEGAGLGGFQRVGGLPAVQSLGAVWSFGPDDVWLTAESGRLLHFDGSKWTETQLDTHAMMLDIWGFAPNDIWMVGGDSLARYDGATWEVSTPSESEPGIEGLAGIWGSSPQDIWVVGTQSTAAHWDGSTWKRHIAAGPENAIVWGSGADDVYVIGMSSVAHWNGSVWEGVEPDGMSGWWEGIWGSGANDVWLTDGSGQMAHFDGSAWAIQELDFVAEASVLWGNGPKNVWGVGTPGGILRYDGSWHEVGHQKIGSPYLRVFHDVHGSAAGDVWIVGTEMGEQGVQSQLYRR
jgi:hypothetical protein